MTKEMNFIRKHAIEQIISKIEEVGGDIFFDDAIEDGCFKIIGLRKRIGKYDSCPIVQTKTKSDVQPGVGWGLLKETTIVDILRTIKNGGFRS